MFLHLTSPETVQGAKLASGALVTSGAGLLAKGFSSNRKTVEEEKEMEKERQMKREKMSMQDMDKGVRAVTVEESGNCRKGTEPHIYIYIYIYTRGRHLDPMG